MVQSLASLKELWWFCTEATPSQISTRGYNLRDRIWKLCSFHMVCSRNSLLASRTATLWLDPQSPAPEASGQDSKLKDHCISVALTEVDSSVFSYWFLLFPSSALQLNGLWLNVLCISTVSFEFITGCLSVFMLLVGSLVRMIFTALGSLLLKKYKRIGVKLLYWRVTGDYWPKDRSRRTGQEEESGHGCGVG